MAGECKLVNVSQRMMVASWPPEEWKPNMAELEVCVVFDERKINAQTKSDFLTGNGFLAWYYLMDVCTLFVERKFPLRTRLFKIR